MLLDDPLLLERVSALRVVLSVEVLAGVAGVDSHEDDDEVLVSDDLTVPTLEPIGTELPDSTERVCVPVAETGSADLTTSTAFVVGEAVSVASTLVVVPIGALVPIGSCIEDLPRVVVATALSDPFDTRVVMDPSSVPVTAVVPSKSVVATPPERPLLTAVMPLLEEGVRPTSVGLVGSRSAACDLPPELLPPPEFPRSSPPPIRPVRTFPGFVSPLLLLAQSFPP